MGYREYRRQLSPPWLLGKFGAALQDVLGSIEDGLVARAKAAVLASFPQFAPSDALPTLGDELGIEPGIRGESDASYRAKLAAAHDLWRAAGTRPGMQRAMEYDFERVTIAEWWEAQLSDDWSVFAIAVLSHPWEPLIIGEFDLGPEVTLGSTATIYEVERVKRNVRRWKPAEMCAWVLICFVDIGEDTSAWNVEALIGAGDVANWHVT